MSLHLTLLIVYSAALIAVGIWIARRVRGSADFFVAGRSLNVPLLFSTVLAANIGAGTTIGAASVAYRDGISAWWWNGSAAIGSVVLATFVGPRIWRIAARHNLYTAGDYLELRYDRHVRGIIAVLIWFGTLAIFAGQLIGGAAILAVVGHIPREIGIAASAVVVTVYFVAGGLLSSAWVNTVELAVKLIGFTVAAFVVLVPLGGLSALTSGNVPSTFGDPLYSAGPRSGWTFLLLLGPAFIVSPGLLQKAYGAASERVVRVGIGAQAVVQAVFGVVPALLGMAAAVTHPGIGDINQVLPTVMIEQLPASISALALAAVYSAEVSTCDAILFMLSTSLSKDLYKRFLHPDATDAQLLRVARGAALAGGIGGVLLAFKLQTVVGALQIFYTLLGVSLFVPIVGGLYVRRATTGAALASIAAGITTAIAVQFTPHAPAWWLDPSLTGIAAAAVVFAAALLIRTK
ncbi:MAG TPA: sodium:solute symporter family protein [Vicinamibacterales bacterium]|nr:sodium:solute symporter family protein [Vicinamibacterales bacterium]